MTVAETARRAILRLVVETRSFSIVEVLPNHTLEAAVPITEPIKPTLFINILRQTCLQSVRFSAHHGAREETRG
jgi:hypothetical protein